MSYRAAIKMSCPRATLARFLPYLASRRYVADRYVCLVRVAAAAASPRPWRSHRSPSLRSSPCATRSRTSSPASAAHGRVENRRPEPESTPTTKPAPPRSRASTHPVTLRSLSTTAPHLSVRSPTMLRPPPSTHHHHRAPHVGEAALDKDKTSVSVGGGLLTVLPSAGPECDRRGPSASTLIYRWPNDPDRLSGASPVSSRFAVRSQV